MQGADDWQRSQRVEWQGLEIGATIGPEIHHPTRHLLGWECSGRKHRCCCRMASNLTRGLVWRHSACVADARTRRSHFLGRGP